MIENRIKTIRERCKKWREVQETFLDGEGEHSEVVIVSGMRLPLINEGYKQAFIDFVANALFDLEFLLKEIDRLNGVCDSEEEQSWTEEEVAEMLNISVEEVRKLSEENGLYTEEYGKWVVGDNGKTN